MCPDQGHETGSVTRWVNQRFDRTSATVYANVVEGCSLQVPLAAHCRGRCFSASSPVPLYLFSLKELAPIEDQSDITVIADASPEAAIEETYNGMRQVVNTLATFEGATEIWHVMMPSASYGGQGFVDPSGAQPFGAGHAL